MSDDWFFEKFALIADAPGAVERMRGLVLEAAVRGKLVRQDPNDDPADELLEKIREARRNLTESEKLKTKVQLAPIGLDQSPYSIPKTWLWVPLNELAELVYGKLLPLTELLPNGFPVFGANGVIGRFSKYLYEDEKLLISCRGAYSGTPNISPKQCYVTNNSIVCEFFDPKTCDIRFYHAVISVSPREKIVTGSAQPQVTVANAIKLPVALPPLAEQKRIVAKVDELMGLCDALESQQQERELRKSVLVRSSLSRFAESPTPENLGYLFHKSYDIPPSELRKSILTLAIQGKLVPQDPNDEPAAEIKMQIAKRMSAIRNQRHHTFAATEDQTDPPFPIPHNWEWMPFGTLGEFLGGGTPSKDNPAYWNGEIPWVSPKDMKRPYICDSIDHVTPLGADASSGRLIPTGALLMVVRGMILAHTFPVAITTREVTINQDMKALRLTVPEIGEYLLRCCTALTGAMLSNVERSSHGTCRIPTEALSSFLVPIPPLAEQRRIVAKVNQLMALVDELERQQEASRENATKLLDAIVQEMTSVG
jgi:type I restriction enzyme S subunit